VFSACVNEEGPRQFVMFLHAQAAIISVTPFPSSVVQTPEAQQSNSIKTSDFDSSRLFWIAAHLTVGHRSFWLFPRLGYKLELILKGICQ
jgi:hypothetical protein